MATHGGYYEFDALDLQWYGMVLNNILNTRSAWEAQ